MITMEDFAAELQRELETLGRDPATLPVGEAVVFAERMVEALRARIDVHHDVPPAAPLICHEQLDQVLHQSLLRIARDLGIAAP
ncbi:MULTISPECIES: hypothetical protein [unclassified Bradyrhizobium]|uniref:hypothetical protein n=1 Tax=unclassified Bradyrhizobium TaxID=2631580 RepID=UPI0028E466B9|nr:MULTISPECIES: hypothetical protein [unclassified Bradyrhizobium]